jgi:hypothetical protein
MLNVECGVSVSEPGKTGEALTGWRREAGQCSIPEILWLRRKKRFPTFNIQHPRIK